MEITNRETADGRQRNSRPETGNTEIVASNSQGKIGCCRNGLTISGSAENLYETASKQDGVLSELSRRPQFAVESARRTEHSRPLAIDLFAGLGGWTEGLLAAGFRVVGFDIERHEYALPEETPQADGGKGTKPVEKRGWTQGCAITLGMEGETARPRTRLARYPAQLVLQDVLTIHGSQFRDAALIVASPPCQNYSYLAMPWSRSKDPENSKAAKALRKKWETDGPDNRLFDACFRIQREASEAAGRHISLVVENVRGAVPWVGRQAAQFGSFYLWGDVAQVGKRVISGRDLADIRAGRGRFGMGVAPEKLQKFPVYSDPRRNGGKGVHLTSPAENAMGTKIGGDWFSDPNSTCRKHGSRSNARKAASALIAKIPFALSEYVAKQHYPCNH